MGYLGLALTILLQRRLWVDMLWTPGSDMNIDISRTIFTKWGEDWVGRAGLRGLDLHSTRFTQGSGIPGVLPQFYSLDTLLPSGATIHLFGGSLGVRKGW